MEREPQRRRKETPVGAIESVSVLFPLEPLICLHPEALALVFPQLVFKVDQAKYEWLREANVFDNWLRYCFK